MTDEERSQFELDQWSLSYDAKRVLLLPGDGVGPEVVGAAREVLEAVGGAFDRQFLFDERPIGGAAIAATGIPLPAETLEACERADAVLLGAVGGPAPTNGRAAGNGRTPERGPMARNGRTPEKRRAAGEGRRPEDGHLALHRTLGLFANLRPVRVGPFLSAASPYKAERLRRIDLMIVRELESGLHDGGPCGITRESHVEGTSRDRALDSKVHSAEEIDRVAEEIDRVAEVAFRLAEGRRGHVTSVDKANVLEVSRLWRRTVEEVAERHPAVEVDHLYVDRAAFQLVRDPSRFDVVLTESPFGDILGDLAGGIAGSIALLPSASLGKRAGLFEPIHGTAFDLAGTGRANPLGAILSAAMMLRHAFGWEAEARAVERAVDGALGDGWHTPDLPLGDGSSTGTDLRCVRTAEMTERVAGTLREVGERYRIV